MGKTRQCPTPQHLRSLFKPHQLPRPVRFEDLGLIVKFGSHIPVVEAINLLAVRRVFQDLVQAHEVYGWRVLEREGDTLEVFIYMQVIPGPTLEQRWSSLSLAEKQTICSDLRTFVFSFRGLLDDKAGEQVIGKLAIWTDTTLLNTHRFHM
jgi:hypothetical protein